MHQIKKKLNKKTQDRLAQALRTNLLKRKQQQRSRSETSPEREQKDNFFHQTDQGFFVNIRLTPSSKQNEIQGLYISPEAQVYLKVNVKAVPENGQANEALIYFMASELGVSKTHVSLVKGEASLFKTLLFSSLDSLVLSQKFTNLIKNYLIER